ADHDLVQFGRGKGLAQQQFAARLHGQVGRGERPRRIAGLEKGAAGPVDDVDGFEGHQDRAPSDSVRDGPWKSGAKSSTAITRSRSTFRARMRSSSSSVRPPAAWTASAMSRTLARGSAAGSRPAFSNSRM